MTTLYSLWQRVTKDLNTLSSSVNSDPMAFNVMAMNFTAVFHALISTATITRQLVYVCVHACFSSSSCIPVYLCILTSQTSFSQRQFHFPQEYDLWRWLADGLGRDILAHWDNDVQRIVCGRGPQTEMCDLWTTLLLSSLFSSLPPSLLSFICHITFFSLCTWQKKQWGCDISGSFRVTKVSTS